MGRQIAIFASEQDEQDLLTYLRETTSIQLFVRAADSETELWSETFAPYSFASSQYFIWNKAYAWRPPVKRDTPVSEGGSGKWYVELPGHGPVIEFDRTDMERFLEAGPEPGCFWNGRIYWAQSNRQKGFAKWFDGIMRWVRRNGRNISPWPTGAWYCLPDAYRLWEKVGRVGSEPSAADFGGVKPTRGSSPRRRRSK